MQDFSCTLTLREIWFLLYAENFGEGRGVSGSTYPMKLKLTPGNGP